VMTRQRLHDTKTNGAGQHGTSFTYRRFMTRVADSRTLFPPIYGWRFSPHYVGRDDDTNGNDGSRRITRDILHADHESVPRERRRRSIHNACVLCVSPLFVRLQVCLQVCLQVRCANAVPPNRGGPREVCLGSMTGRTFGLGNADAGKTLRSARPVGRIPGMRAGCATNRSPCSS